MGFISAVRERTEEENYHTRFAYNNMGTRGIDHIMASDEGYDLYLAGRVARLSTAVIFPSIDHAIVQCDLRLGFKYTTNADIYDEESHDNLQYRRIAKIQVRRVITKDEEGRNSEDIIFDEKQPI